ncbi:MAG: peptidylprolyl isomerase [Mariprofundales bacterium]|nr:peptidylprolyl isomerase [Mariprofundales bacterium]
MALSSRVPQAGDDDIPAGDGVVITTKYGDIVIDLFADVAPNTVANFKYLVGRGFYDGLLFHRVIDGFMAQGGCPDGTGTGGPGYKIEAEFNERPHLRGSVAMARAADPDSAGSQFYICYGEQRHLDGHYSVFGQVVSGMDVVDRIEQGDVMQRLRLIEQQ